MGSRPRYRSPAAQQEEIERLRLASRQALNDIQGWCSLCAGYGMVMDFGGPTDCPNLDQHRIIAGVDNRPVLMSKKEAAAYIGLDPRSLNRHMREGRLPSQLVGMTAVFVEADVMLFKQTYWY